MRGRHPARVSPSASVHYTKTKLPMNSLPVISVRKRPRLLLRAGVLWQRARRRLSPLAHKGKNTFRQAVLRFRQMWRHPKQRKVFLGTTASLGILTLLLALLHFWPVAPNRFSSHPLRPGTVLAQLPEVNMRVEARTSGQPRFSVIRNQASFEFAVPGDATVLAQNNETSLTFRNKEGQEVHYSLQNNGIKEEIKLFSKSTTNTFSTQIRVSNVFVSTSPNGQLYFSNKDGEYQFHIEAPFAQDAAGDTTWGVHYRLLDSQGNNLLEQTEDRVKQEMLSLQEVEIENNYELQVVVEKEWLDSPDRQYPILIDPTIIHDTSSEFSSGIFQRAVDNGSGSSPVLQANYQEGTTDASTVGLWHFNEGVANSCTGGSNDACDASGKGNDGAFQGSASFTSSSKLGSHALEANGTGNYLRVPNNATLNPAQQITVEAWIKTTTTGASATIVSKTTGCASSGYLLWLNQNSIGAGIPSFWIGAGAWLDGTYAINDGTWHHVAGVFDGSTAYLYVDGQLVNAAARTGSLSSTTDLGIGGAVSCGNTFAGSIDEVRISNVARSAEHIAASASRAPHATYTSPTLSPANVMEYVDLSWNELGTATGDGETISDATGLVAQWNFNNTSGTTATNNAGSCGSSCNGTLNNFASTGSQDAAVGSGWTSDNRRWGAGALMFDGTNDFVQSNSSSPLNFTSSDFSMDGWFRFEDLTTREQILFGNGTHQLNGYYFYWANDRTLRFATHQSGARQDTYSIPYPVQTGTWHHIAVTRSGSTVKIYVDGKDVTRISGTHIDPTNTSSSFTIGAIGTMTQSLFFDGAMDSLRVFSRTLSPTEVAAHAQVGNIELQTRTSANGSTWEDWKPTTAETALATFDSDASNWSWDNGSTYVSGAKSDDTTIKMEGTSSLKINTAEGYTDANLFAFWKLDETGGTGAYIKDSSGNNRHITPYNGPTVAQGISGKARKFDGSNDYITGNHGVAGNSSAIDFWFRTTSTTRAPLIWVSNTAPPTNSSHVPAVIMNANGTIRGEMWTGSVGAITSSKSYNDGRWHHVVLAGTSNAQALIIDGEQIGARAGTIQQTWWTHTTIGAGFDSTARGASADGWSYFNGEIDEVRIFSNVLGTEAALEAYRLTGEHLLERTVSSTDLSGKTMLPFYIAADRPGTYLEISAAENSYKNNSIDANTVALWNLEEGNGVGNYLKDISGNNLHLTPTGSTFTKGKTTNGARYLNGSSYLNVSDNNLLDPAAITLEAWVKPASLHTGNFINKGDNSGYRFRTTAGGAFQFLDRGGTNNLATATNTYSPNTWYHVVATGDSTGLKIYVNGALAASNSTPYGGPNTTASFSVGNYPGELFTGVVDQVRVSNVARTADEIRQSYEAGLRAHKITIEFGASLDSGNLISGSGDTSFTIDARTRGLRQKGSRIYVGEKIIVRENYNGTEYIAQATVTSVNASTGAITTAAWDSGSTFPPSGYTANADVFKWQREYWNISKAMDNQVDAVTNLSLRITDGNEGRTIWLDDLRSSGGYMSDPTGTSITSTTQAHFQYRAIFTSAANTSPQLTSVSLQYDQAAPSESPVFANDSLHDKLKTKDTTPTISFVASQQDNNDLVYEVQWDDDADFVGASSAVSDANAGFVNTDTGSDTSPFNSGETVAYTWQSALTNGNTYFYRVRAKDPAGSNVFGDWSETRSLTIDTSLLNDGWFETHADQFASDTLEPNIEVDDTGNFVYVDPTGAPAFSRPITITNSGSTLTNHHTLLTIDTATIIGAGKMQSDCDDLRFYDQNDTELTYWIESDCNTASTKIWVEVPSLPNGNTDITMYYGDLTSSAGGETYAGSMVAGFDSTCPVGWTAMSTLNSGNYYIRGGTAAVGTTGGSSSHTHSATITTGGPSKTDSVGPQTSDNDNATAHNHTHTWSGITGSANNTPPYYDLVFCQATGIPQSLPTNYVGMFTSTPTGWTRFSALDNRFLRANTSAGGTGGTSTHSHSVSGTFPVTATMLADNGDNERQVSRNTHTHSFSMTSGTTSSLPAYSTLIFAKPNSPETLVDGQIAMMSTNDEPPLGWTRYTSLDNKMPYGSSTAETTGGSDTHTHTLPVVTTGSDSTSVSVDTGNTRSAGETGHTHNTVATNTASANLLPPYYTMSFYQRKTDNTSKSLGSEVSSLRRLLISTPITATSITSARWDKFTFNDDTTFGNITYRVYYDNNGTPERVPNEDLPGNSGGFTTSPVDLSSLSTAEYPVLYLGADMLYSNGTPELLDWGITFNQPPETPTLIAPADSVVLSNLTPTLQLSTTDNENDYLRYKIEMCLDAEMSLGCQTFDQTVSQTDWSGQNTQTGTAYTSGTTASYNITSQLPINTTYYWRGYAIDPGGADWWSDTQSPVWSFTTPNLVPPMQCLLEESADDSQIILRWDDPNVVETGYEIERNVSTAGFSTLTTTGANVTTTTDTDVSPDNSYQYRVRALLGSSTTDWCTSPLLEIETGHLMLEGIQGEGLQLD